MQTAQLISVRRPYLRANPLCSTKTSVCCSPDDITPRTV